MVILEKRDREADEKKIMAQHDIVSKSLLEQLREEAMVSAREQVSERINRRPQNNVPRFYNFKK